MFIKVLCKKMAEHFVFSTPWAVISISDKHDHLPELSSENRVGLLQLCFLDVSDPDFKSNKGGIFSYDQALEIIDFYSQMKDQVEMMLVHCEAGLSRSPGVAAALTIMQDGLRSDQFWFNCYHPNILVYRRILEKFYEKNEELE